MGLVKSLSHETTFTTFVYYIFYLHIMVIFAYLANGKQAEKQNDK